MSGKRKRTDEEKQLAALRDHTTVACKLASLGVDGDLVDEIRRTSLILKRIQMEAWHVANLHVLRCLDQDLATPTIDHNFFRWCCQGVRERGFGPTAKQAARGAAAASSAMTSPRRPDEHHQATVRLYRAECAVTDDYVPPPEIKYESASLNAMAEQMRVNAGNMVALNFRKRLALYIRLKLEDGSAEAAPKTEIDRLVQACYRRADAEFSEDEQLLRDWLGISPYENVIKNNLKHFVKKLHEIMITVESTQSCKPNKKGVRAFTLLPMSSSFAAAHVVINGSTLHGFCSRLYERVGANPLQIPPSTRGTHLAAEPVVRADKDIFLRRAFSVAKFETMAPGATITKRQFDAMDHHVKAPYASRLFANQVTTNGYSASVLLRRPKTEQDQDPEVSRPAKKPRCEKPSTLVDDEWRALPFDYEADMVIGVDPGLRRLCTAVREGDVMPPQGRIVNQQHKRRVRNKRRKRRRRKRQRVQTQPMRAVCENPGTRQVTGQVIHMMRSREYRHLAGFNKQRDWFENLKRRESEYGRVLEGIPSFKTATFETYLARLKYFWRQVDFLINFCATKGFLKWRFLCKRMRLKTLDSLAKRVVPVASPRVLVGYGDWSRGGGIRGHGPVPVKGFRAALKRRGTVLPIDEYRTSKLCSSCHGRLAQARLRIEDAAGSWMFWEQTENVLRCPFSSCEATVWDRDVNAARNMLCLLKAKLLGLERPAAFSRP